MATRRIMHIDFDAFFVSVEQRDNPSLKGKPVIVGGKPNQRGVAAAVSYEARKYGIHSGMPLSKAYRLCPQAIFIEGSFRKYLDAARSFMAILLDFSPFMEPMGIDEAFLDVTGFESIHGSAEAMGRKIRKRLKDELKLNASIGIAGSKLLAKIASKEAKPDGLLEVPPGEETTFLTPMPVSKMPGIGKKTGQVLKGLGVHTLGRLGSFPLDVLKSHFGINGRLMRDYARGIDNSKVTLPAEAKSISRETTFAEDTHNKMMIEDTLRYLTEKVGAKLREKQKLAQCITVKVRFTDFSYTTRRRTINKSTNADDMIFNTGLEMLERELRQQRQAVRLVGIGVSHFCEGRQLDMLDNGAGRLQNIAEAVDRIRNKYGFKAIQTGRTHRLKDLFPEDDNRGYTLHTPGLSR
jgi:DNA polymerase-4